MKKIKSKYGKKSKKKIIIISSVVALCVVLTTAAIGFLLYFNSPAYAAAQLYRAIEEKDGEKLNELIFPEERDYINSLLKPIDMTIEDTVDPIHDALITSSGQKRASFDTEYSRNGNEATFTAKPSDEGNNLKIDLNFKKQGGKWYFSPMELVEALPIKTGLKVIGAVKTSNGNEFLDCVLPSESWILKFGLAGLGLDKDKILERFASSSGIKAEEGKLPNITAYEVQEDEISLVITPEDGNDVRLAFVKHEGEWYLSVKKILFD